jgi:hypothetical protein
MLKSIRGPVTNIPIAAGDQINLIGKAASLYKVFKI